MKIRILTGKLLCGSLGFLCFMFFIGLSSSVKAAQEDNLQIALQAYKDGLYDVAESILKKEVEDNILAPASAKLLLAKVYIKENKYNDALSLLVELRAQADLPDNLMPDLYILLGNVYQHMGNLEQAKVIFKDMLTFASPKMIREGIKNLCDIYIDKKDFSSVLSLLKKYSKEKNRSVREIVCYEKAKLTYTEQDYNKAKSLFEEFINKFPDSEYLSSAYFYLGEVNYVLGQYKEAIKYFDKIALIYKGKKLGGYALQAKAWALIRLGDFDEAQAALKTAKSFIGRTTDTIRFAWAFMDYKKGNYKQAKKAFESILNDYPNTVWKRDVLFWLAETYFALGNYAKALNLYSQVLSIEPSSKHLPDLDDVVTNSYYGIAWCYLNEGKYKQAMEYFQRVSDINDDPMIKVGAQVKIADTLLLIGQYQKALDKYFSIQKNFPQNYYSDYILYQIANTLMKMGDYEKAILSYEELLKQYPKSEYISEVKYNLSMAYFNLGNFGKTIEILSKLKSSNKDSKFQPNLDYVLANAYFNQKKYKKALHLFRKIMESLSHASDKRIEVEYELAWCYYRLGRIAEAKKRFRRIVKEYPDDLLSREVLLWLAERSLAESKYFQAKKYLEEFVSRYPKSPQRFKAYYDLAWLFYFTGKKDKALDLLSKYLSQKDNPIKADFYLARAYIYQELGKLKLAIADVKTVLKDYPIYNRKALEMLSEIYYDMHRFADSAYALEQILAKNPNLKDKAKLIFKIGKIWEEAGELDKAIEFYVKLAYNTELKDQQLKIKAILKAAKLYEKKGRIKEAVQLYKKVARMNVPQAKLAREKLKYYQQ